MNLIHGTWIPDETTDFVQPGGFYLWVECDAVTDKPARHGDSSIHPRSLTAPALAAFLSEKLGIQEQPGIMRPVAIRPIYLQLPSAGGAPLPSFELQPYVDSEIPDEFALASWQVSAYRVPNVCAT